MKKTILLVVVVTTSIILSAQPVEQFTKAYGGAMDESGMTIRQLPDKGYIIAGQTESFGAGSADIWLIRTNENGDTLWTKLLADRGLIGSRGL